MQPSNMVSAPVNQRPFRFLDLPAELRLCVYENIEFPSTWHVLDRTQALIRKRDWPVPPKAQIHGSRVTLIRPHTPPEILVTCHIINEEARSILKRKMEHYRFQPVRYLVGYSAAWALVGASSALRSCIGVADGGISECENRAVRDFLQMCTLYLSQERRTQNGLRSIRAIEMTVTHNNEVVYGREILETMMWLHELKFDSPTRLVVIYKSPLPRTQMFSNAQIGDSSDLEKILLQEIPRDTGIGDQASLDGGVFVRPLKEEAFEKHVQGLELF